MNENKYEVFVLLPDESTEYIGETTADNHQDALKNVIGDVAHVRPNGSGGLESFDRRAIGEYDVRGPKKSHHVSIFYAPLQV